MLRRNMKGEGNVGCRHCDKRCTAERLSVAAVQLKGVFGRKGTLKPLTHVWKDKIMLMFFVRHLM